MVKNIELCTKVLEMIQTLSELTDFMMNLCRSGAEGFEENAALAKDALDALYMPIQTLESEEPALSINHMRENALYSLKRVCRIYSVNKVKAASKIEFELNPIICELYVDIYFFSMVYPDKEKIYNYYNTDMPLLCPLTYAEQAKQTGHYKYELSIIVAAYNHLGTTINCINNLKQNIPPDLNYELILFNNGSKDGTQEYFQSINPTKQVDYYNNVKSQWGILCRIAEGQYIMVVSNDVLMTPHSIENLLCCIKSDKTIGMIAPTTPNVANLQTIPACYHNYEELLEFCKKNNISDSFRWEQRVRLNPPVYMFPNNNLYAKSIMDYGYIYDSHLMAFGDDKAGMLLRRNGYKNIVCKDAYVHHIGSMTIAPDIKKTRKEAEYYLQGRRSFKQIFDIDPWGAGCCYSPSLMQNLDPHNKGHVDILGINCGMGENSLHIREMLKQNVHNTDVVLYNATDDKSYEQDLAGISDYFKLLKSLHDISENIGNRLFDYIVMQDQLAQKSLKKLIEFLYAHLKTGGKLALCLKDLTTGQDITKLKYWLDKQFNGRLIDADRVQIWYLLEKE